MLLALSALIFLLQARLWGEIEDYPLGPGVDSDDVSILGTGGRYNIMSHRGVVALLQRGVSRWGVVALKQRGEIGASRRGVVALQQRGEIGASRRGVVALQQ